MRNPFDFFDKIFCINLDSRADRWEQVLGEFDKAGIKDRVERFPAIFIEGNAARGNHLSHAECLRLAKESNCSNVLIFEDDLEWLENPLELKRILPDLPKNWDMLYLGVNTELPHMQVERHISRLLFAFSTHAYAINSRLFDKLIEINLDEKTTHNDVLYCTSIIPFYNCYATIPMIAGQRKSFSNIMQKEMDSNPILLDRFYTNLIRRDFPILEQTFVTFITPTLGRKTLEKTVESVINQTEWNWKMEIMFDGRLPNYIPNNDHINVRHCERKYHAGLVRNESLIHVTTDWIAFVDDDDYLAEDYVHTLMGNVNDFDLVVFTYKDVHTGNTQPPPKQTKLEFGHVGISFAVRTDFLIQNKIEFRNQQCEDWIFIEECLSKGARWKMTHEVKYFVGGRGLWREPD